MMPAVRYVRDMYWVAKFFDFLDVKRVFCMAGIVESENFSRKVFFGYAHSSQFLSEMFLITCFETLTLNRVD